MQILNFESYLYERLGVSDDVVILSEFLFNKLSGNTQNKVVIKDIPIVSFKINFITIFFKDVQFNAFDLGRSKMTKNGYDIYLIISKHSELKSALFHELLHVIKFQKLTSKKLKMIPSDISYADKRFGKLIDMLYRSDESEINAKVSQRFIEIKDFISDFSKKDDKKRIFKKYIQIVDDYANEMINYDMSEDLKDISDKDIIRFIKYISKVKEIKRESNNKFIIAYKVIKYILTDKPDYDFRLNRVMKDIQCFINNQGQKLKIKTHKLYDLI